MMLCSWCLSVAAIWTTWQLQTLYIYLLLVANVASNWTKSDVRWDPLGRAQCSLDRLVSLSEFHSLTNCLNAKLVYQRLTRMLSANWLSGTAFQKAQRATSACCFARANRCSLEWRASQTLARSVLPCAIKQSAHILFMKAASAAAKITSIRQEQATTTQNVLFKNGFMSRSSQTHQQLKRFV